MKISVIVPVYNGECYIKECLDSLLAQLYLGMEIIVVNDGSTDDTAIILEKYNGITSLSILHQKNKGRMLARKAGLNFARGVYVGFVDADDFVAPCMYKELHRVAVHNDADIVSCGFINVDKNGKEIGRQIFPNDFADQRVYKILADNPPSLCNSIFRKELFEFRGISFLPLHRGEDLVMVPCLFYYAKKTVMLQESYYYYRNIYDNTDTGLSNGAARLPINLHKDLMGLEDLYEAAEVLAEFFADKETIASDLISYTTKFPDLFNRYNHKYTSMYFEKHSLWHWYFTKLLQLLCKYPQYYTAQKLYTKIENQCVIKSFEQAFFPQNKHVLDALASPTIACMIEDEHFIIRYIHKFRIRLRKNLRAEFVERVKNKVKKLFSIA